MKLSIEINNKSGGKVKKEFFASVIKKTLEFPGFEFLVDKNISISVALVGEKEIKNLNKIYRHKNAVTDVLSFAEYKNTEALKKEKGVDVFLGELVLCYNDISDYAKSEGIEVKKELVSVVAHGTLHLVGGKHGKKMFEAQKKIIEEIK